MQQQPYQPAQQNHTMGIISLILGILGVIGVLPIVGAVAAIITGNMAKKDIAANPSMYQGPGMANAGVILGWIGVALGLVVCCAILFAFALPVVLALIGSAIDSSSLLPALIALV